MGRTGTGPGVLLLEILRRSTKERETEVLPKPVDPLLLFYHRSLPPVVHIRGPRKGRSETQPSPIQGDDSDSRVPVGRGWWCECLNRGRRDATFTRKASWEVRILSSTDRHQRSGPHKVVESTKRLRTGVGNIYQNSSLRGINRVNSHCRRRTTLGLIVRENKSESKLMMVSFY